MVNVQGMEEQIGSDVEGLKLMVGYQPQLIVIWVLFQYLFIHSRSEVSSASLSRLRNCDRRTLCSGRVQGLEFRSIPGPLPLLMAGTWGYECCVWA